MTCDKAGFNMVIGWRWPLNLKVNKSQNHVHSTIPGGTTANTGYSITSAKICQHPTGLPIWDRMVVDQAWPLKFTLIAFYSSKIKIIALG